MSELIAIMNIFNAINKIKQSLLVNSAGKSTDSCVTSSHSKKLTCLVAILLIGTLLTPVAESQDTCLVSASELIMPKKDPSGAYKVGIGIQPHSLTNFNTREGTAEIDFYFTIEYELEGQFRDKKCLNMNHTENVWSVFFNPRIEFRSIPNPREAQGSHWLIDNNRFAYQTRINGTIFLNGDFRLFPFDTVIAAITMTGGEDDSTLLLVPSTWYMPDYPDLSKEISDLKISGWSLLNARFVNRKYQWRYGRFGDGLDFELEVSRPSLPFLVRAGVPLSLIFFIALTTRFAFLGNSRIQMPILSTLLLSIFAYSIYLNELIPEVEYLTFGDFIWIGVLASVALITFGQALYFKMKRKQLFLRLEALCLLASISIYATVLLATAIVFLR